VHAARTRSELDSVLRELPAAVPPTRRRPARLAAAVFGHFVRRGRWRLGRWTWAASLFADLDIDVREAQLDGPSATIVVTAFFGNVDLYVPEGVETDLAGVPVFGHCRTWGRETARSGAPFVRVRMFGLFGTVDLWRVPPGTQGSFGDVIKLLRRQQKELSPG
jgi:Cell wall-active antibiotics response 4TMS YvqF